MRRVLRADAGERREPARFRHHADTCAALHIHPNTLYKRLRRIAELLGEDWDGPERALDTHLALRLHRLR